MKAPIPVVAAVIEKDGLVLLAQRPPGKALALKWEFPGGKVEPGESPEAALRREIREELGCEIEITGTLRRFIHHYETVSIDMIPLRARLAAGSPPPHPHEHVALQWLPLNSVAAMDLPTADLPVLKELLASAGS
jgi:8-oxo-dGTP diphosphatase